MRHTRSECAACGAVFAGVRAFDAHRVGSYHFYIRRCLTASDLRTQVLIQDARGWWMLPEASTELHAEDKQLA